MFGGHSYDRNANNKMGQIIALIKICIFSQNEAIVLKMVLGFIAFGKEK